MGNVDMDWLLAGGVVYWPAWSSEYYLKYVTMGANQEAIYGGQDGDVLLGYDQTVVWVDLVKLELVEQSIGGMNGLRMATRAECESAGIEYIERPVSAEELAELREDKELLEWILASPAYRSISQRHYFDKESEKYINEGFDVIEATDMSYLHVRKLAQKCATPREAIRAAMKGGA